MPPGVVQYRSVGIGQFVGLMQEHFRPRLRFEDSFERIGRVSAAADGQVGGSGMLIDMSGYRAEQSATKCIPLLVSTSSFIRRHAEAIRSRVCRHLNGLESHHRQSGPSGCRARCPARRQIRSAVSAGWQREISAKLSSVAQIFATLCSGVSIEELTTTSGRSGGS